MYKKKIILIAAFLAILSLSGIFLIAHAKEKKPENSTTENQINTEEIQIPQAPKKPKKDSTSKKEKPKTNNKNETSGEQQRNENNNEKNTENIENKESPETQKQEVRPTQKENKKEAETEKEEEKKENSLDLPNVNNSEVELKPYFSQISQNEEKKSILKTIISWVLILSGIGLILSVIFSNRKIPKNYTVNKKSKHIAMSHKGKNTKYKL